MVRRLSVCVAVIMLLATLAQGQTPAFLRILEPCPEQIVPGPDVYVQFEAAGVPYAPCGYSIHFQLDDEPFEVQYDPCHPHCFQDVLPGTHFLRAWAATPSHEIIPCTLSMVIFSVVYPNDENRPEYGYPLLTLNLPQGEYRGIDAADVTLDFMVSSACLSRTGYRVNYYVDGRRYVMFDCRTTHIKDLAPGKHTVRVELLSMDGHVVPGPFNSVERVIMISPDRLPDRLARGEKAPEQPVITSIHGAMTVGRPSEPFIEIHKGEKAKAAASSKARSEAPASPGTTRSHDPGSRPTVGSVTDGDADVKPLDGVVQPISGSTRGFTLPGAVVGGVSKVPAPATPVAPEAGLETPPPVQAMELPTDSSGNYITKPASGRLARLATRVGELEAGAKSVPTSTTSTAALKKAIKRLAVSHPESTSSLKALAVSSTQTIMQRRPGVTTSTLVPSVTSPDMRATTTSLRSVR